MLEKGRCEDEEEEREEGWVTMTGGVTWAPPFFIISRVQLLCEPHSFYIFWIKLPHKCHVGRRQSKKPRRAKPDIISPRDFVCTVFLSWGMCCIRFYGPGTNFGLGDNLKDLKWTAYSNSMQGLLNGPQPTDHKPTIVAMTKPKKASTIQRCCLFNTAARPVPQQRLVPFLTSQH